MFKVIETEQELEDAIAANALWVNLSGEWPRAEEWRHERDTRRAKHNWERANKEIRDDPDTAAFLPCDFAVLIEE
jgi:hypothetical protein